MGIHEKLVSLLSRKRAGLWISLLLFSAAFLVFILSPVRSLGETQYTMMLGHTLLHRRTFALDRNELRIPEPLPLIGNSANVKGLPLELVNGKVYKYAPPGSAVLSLPFLVLANWFGLKPVDANGIYDPERELRLSSILAALLTATFAVLCFQFAHLILPLSWSLAVAAGAAFGTQVWSTASRVVEPDSWTLLLLLSAVFLLVAAELGKARFRPVVIASILSWCYFVHPTTAISIIALTVYVWLFQRGYFWYFVSTGAVWLLLLLAYSWHNFGQLLPNYYKASRLGFQTFWEALAGNLISPSRGLLIYVPVLFLIAFLLLRNRRVIIERRLVFCGAIVAAVHLFTISGFEHWWAGHSYGPRYWTSLVPWFVLLAVFALRALQVDSVRNAAWKTETASVVLLALLGVLIHARGALAEETRLWNARPYDIDLRAGRLWNWTYPQFLAGLVRPPLPAEGFAPVPLNQRIDLSSETASPFLWYGWSEPESEIRWSDGKEAAFVFAFDNSSDLKLVMRATPFIVAGELETQRLIVKLNGKEIHSLMLNRVSPGELVIPLSAGQLKRENVLLFDLPEAESPAKFRLSTDRRPLGIAVQWIEFQAQTAPRL